MEPPIFTCSNCMCAFFLQIERRMTGVVIDEGKIVVQPLLESKIIHYFVCRRCGCIVPNQRIAAFKFERQLQEPAHN